MTSLPWPSPRWPSTLAPSSVSASAQLPFVGENFNLGRHSRRRAGEERDLTSSTRRRSWADASRSPTNREGGHRPLGEPAFQALSARRGRQAPPGISRIQHVLKEYGGRTTYVRQELENLHAIHPPALLSGFDLIKYDAREYASQLIGRLLENDDIRSMDPRGRSP